MDAYSLALREDPLLPDLVLAGLGVAPPDLLARIDQLHLTSRVRVVTDVPREELPALYRRASAFVQASYEEGLGISVLEAMASGLPIVATDTDGTRETVVHGTTGWLVTQDSDAAVAQGIARRILESRTIGAEVGARARRRCVEEFSRDVMLGRHLSVYEWLLSRRSDR